jgi:hypothetical protein
MEIASLSEHAGLLLMMHPFLLRLPWLPVQRLTGHERGFYAWNLETCKDNQLPYAPCHDAYLRPKL